MASYPYTDAATIKYKGRNYDMRIAVSASGARYVGGALEWWTKGSGAGSEGTLFRHLRDGTSGQSIEHCTESLGRKADARLTIPLSADIPES